MINLGKYHKVYSNGGKVQGRDKQFARWAAVVYNEYHGWDQEAGNLWLIKKVLNELILVLKGEMFEYQTTKKKEEEAEEVKRDKLISKYQYEVDQILQKHNEEIAKIHNLKDLTNSKRSERVVYSSLFKKLEKEIKHY